MYKNSINQYVASKAYPTSVKVGDTGSWDAWVGKSLDLATVFSNGVISYAVEADGASTSSVILVISVKSYEPVSTLKNTVQTRFRIKPASAAELVSIDWLSAQTGKHYLAQ